MDNYIKDDESSDEHNGQNPILLLKYPDKFKHNFYQSAKKSKLLLESQQYQQCVLYLNKALDLLDLGKDILKNISPYWKVCLYGNFACAYQRLWQIDRCAKYCQKVQNQLKKLFQQQSRKEHKLNFTNYLIRIKFERCALLSQLNKHQEAIEVCRSIFPLLQIFLVVVSGHIQGKLKNEKIKKSRDNISFMEQVYEFSRKVNKNLLKNLKEPLHHQSKEHFYYWSKNPEKNQQQVIRKFVGTKQSQKWKKSILGVTKSKNWINQFNISSIMHINEFHLEDFEKPSPIQEYVFKEKIYETVIYCSLAHFTLATEIRFIEFSKQKIQIQKNSEGKIEVINKKYGYEDKSSGFIASQAHHLKAINLISKNIQFNIPYLTHIIRSYEKHYISNKPLEKISSIAEESALSGTIQKQGPSTLEDNHDGQGMISCMNKKKYNCFQKNKVISPPKILKEKKSIFSKFSKNSDFVINLGVKRRNKKTNKSFSKGKKKKCTSADLKKSEQNFSGKKDQMKSSENHKSLFEIFEKGQKQLKIKSDSKLSSTSLKKIVINKMI